MTVNSRIIDTAGDLELFQQDLDSLHQWSVRNFMNFNVKKCKIMKITKKIQPLTSSFFLENSELEEVKEFKDLGIITNHHLSWNPHIDYIVSKANRILGLIKRIVKVWMTLRPCVLFTAHWSTQIWNIVQRCGPHIQREILISWKEYREERLNLS